MTIRLKGGWISARLIIPCGREGTVEVLNTRIKDGEPKEAKGKGKLTDSPALLRVSFFGPFYADYRVMMLDSAYQYALIERGLMIICGFCLEHRS